MPLGREAVEESGHLRGALAIPPIPSGDLPGDHSHRVVGIREVGTAGHGGDDPLQDGEHNGSLPWPPAQAPIGGVRALLATPTPDRRRSVAGMTYEHVLLERHDWYTTITMNRPDRRNALSSEHMAELTDACRAAGASDARGIVLAGNGPVFCAGHDFGEMLGSDLVAMRALLAVCTELMETIQSVPQPVIARVHGLATAAGCQLVATCDLAVASADAGFAIPGGKGGWFCHTPLVAVARNVGRKRAAELAFTGDAIDAVTALDWGLVNRVVPANELDDAVLGLLERATRGSAMSKGLGKHGFYAQVDLDQQKAYAYAVELMAAASQTADAQEGMASFVEKRPSKFVDR